MMELCLVNKDFYHMGMEAIFETDILEDAVYWDPVRGTKVFYEKKMEDEGYTYPCLLDALIDLTDDEDDDPPRYFRVQPTLSGDLLRDSLMFDFTLSNEFWIRFLTARTLGKIKTKPPTRDHIVLKDIAERMRQYKVDQHLSCNTTPEGEIRVVCEIVVKYGYIHDRRDFFIGDRSDDDFISPSCLDETCAVVRDGLLSLAIYYDEPEILRKILSKEQLVACPKHFEDKRSNIDQSSDEEAERLAPYTPWLPGVAPITYNKKSEFRPPECGRSLLRLANPPILAVHMDNMNCASILLDSITGHSDQQEIVRNDIINESTTPERLHWLRFAINSGPSLTKYSIVLPGLQHEIDWFGRTDYSGRKQAAINLSKILDKTKSVEVFDVVYDAILAGLSEKEGVWWTKTSYRHSYGAHSLASWGTARIHRAVVDDCMPLVKRLVELGYHLGPTHTAEELQDERVKTLMDSEKPRDISLQLSTSRGDLEMVELLFDIGAEKNRKNVRKAIRIAMEQNNLAILQVLMEKGNPRGLLNKRHKRRWRQELEERGQHDMLPWLGII
jgi:hypothetical protein